ncbi:hypothetical protein JKP88DRAFT_230775 [Tribonema minus]|uniref:Uncharacterized protein n=1 Tax=Tribonema minus TaxID=303371 RepID=A0A835ZN57_9STRA|nr:hypothetical protein JKP88DRAFT_230775 [Tribonema minus]
MEAAEGAVVAAAAAAPQPPPAAAAAPAPAAALTGGSSSDGLEQQLRDVDTEIKKVGGQIENLEKEIDQVMVALEKQQPYRGMNVEELKEEKKQLREEKKQLREKEKQLRRKEELLLEGNARLRDREAMPSPPVPVEPFVRAVTELLRPIAQAVNEHLSATVPASKMPADKLSVLRAALNGQLTPVYGTSDLLVQLLGPQPSETDEFFGWDGGIEPALRPQYSEEIKKGLWHELGHRQLPRDLVWIDARNITLKKHINGVLFPVSTRNDELLIVRDFYGTPQNGAILGVELKKRLTWQGIRQAETEFILWQAESNYPFCQMVTDLNTGGVAFFALPGDGSGLRIMYMVLPSMAEVWRFMGGLVRGLDVAALTTVLRVDAPGSSLPQQLEEPRRVKPRLDGQPAVADARLTREQLLWKQISIMRANENDVACLQDLADFGDKPYPDGVPYHW